MTKNIPELFGSMVFNDAVMKQRLPKDVYQALRKTIVNGTHLELDVANVVANAMKDWAVEKGVTHFTHWFQPMTGITAEKHDSFIERDGNNGVIMDFSGKALVQGEPDASSFPNGGLRATFEARGYTAWDPTSYAFIKENTLCIPTAFCSYSGEALDKKTPLLRSMQAINTQALRILRLFGDQKTKRVVPSVGPEQEYFLIDKEVYRQREDLMYCGRTLFGARPPKGQEMEDHYFGVINPRISDYMQELDEELWKLGVLAKTKHNEVAPAQYELAPIYSQSNLSTDHNQLTMELMKSVADKHGMVCLLHEKPFATINGSGKHINWSITTDSGTNLLEPGETPAENAQFLLFLTAVIKAVDEYQDLLRVSVASAGNDHRLGANEAPPAIISMYLGEELSAILEALEHNNIYVNRHKEQMEIGAVVLPHFLKDTTDRNRTSPFAFTGNKFEFRMPGSALSISGPNVILNTIVAQALYEMANELEGSKDMEKALNTMIKRVYRNHKRIIFNGNGYDESWIEEAQQRGLSNLRSTPDALQALLDKKNIELFTRHGVLSEHELRSRYDILLENYSKTLHIEASTMLNMIQRQILPSVFKYEEKLAVLITEKQKLSMGLTFAAENAILTKITRLSDCLYQRMDKLHSDLIEVKGISDAYELAHAYRYTICNDMDEVRLIADELEAIISKDCWTLPDTAEILNSIEES